MPSIADRLEQLLIGPKTYSGGRNVEWSQSMSIEPEGGGITPNQLIELVNMDVSSMGSLKGRKGMAKINSTAINSGGRIYSIYFYYKATTTTSYCMVQSGTAVGTLNLTTGAWTSQGTGLAATPLKWLTWMDNCYAFNGTGMYKFDGTTWSQVQSSDADTPDSVDGCVFQDVLFTAWDGTSLKSRVPYSSAFDAETWAATDIRRIREQDGQEIVGIDVIGNKIVCRRSQSTLYLHGSSIYAFSEEFLSEQIGQIGRMTTGVKEGSLMWQGNNGVIFFDPNTPLVFNNIARDTCNTEIMDISRANRDAAVGIYHPKTYRYLLSYPDETTPIIYVFYMNIPHISKDGNVWFPHSTYTGKTISAMGVDDVRGSAGKIYFGDTAGFVYEGDNTYQDAGTNIDTKVKWGYTDCGIPNQTKNFARVYIPAEVTGALSITLDADFSNAVSTKNTEPYTRTDALVWNTDNWDEANWDAQLIGTSKSRHLKVNGIRAAVRIQKSIDDFYELQPISLEYFPKEKVRWP